MEKIKLKWKFEMLPLQITEICLSTFLKLKTEKKKAK